MKVKYCVQEISCDDMRIFHGCIILVHSQILLFCVDESFETVSLFFGISILLPTLQCLCNFLSLCSEKSNCYRLQSVTKTTRQLYYHARV